MMSIHLVWMFVSHIRQSFISSGEFNYKKLWVKSALSTDSGSGSGSLSPHCKSPFPVQLQSAVSRTEPGGPLRVTAAVRLINRVKMSYKVVSEFCSRQWTAPDQNLMSLQVFIPPAGLVLSTHTQVNTISSVCVCVCVCVSAGVYSEMKAYLISSQTTEVQVMHKYTTHTQSKSHQTPFKKDTF